MLKKDVIDKAKAKSELNEKNVSLNEAFRCGECFHFKRHAHSEKEKVCSLEGVRSVGLAPKCFTPDISAVVDNTDQFVQLASLFQSSTHKQRRILLGLLKSQKKNKWPIGTKVYFKIGKDYISNYLSAYSAGYTSTGQLMLIGSPDRKTRGSKFTACFSADASDLLSHSEWKIKYNQLKDEGKLYDSSNKFVTKQSIVDAYKPPTLDTVPPEWYDKKDDHKKRRKTDPLEFTYQQGR